MLTDDLEAALAELDGLTAGELARAVGHGSDEEVAFALLASHRRFRCDRASPPRWHLNSWRASPERPAVESANRRPAPLPAPRAASLDLYAWQAEALEAWGTAGRRGVVEAVTGAGKTMVGVGAALAERERRGQVLVLVPTVELAAQWDRELSWRLGPLARVGRLGGGRSDSLRAHEVLVAVVNSARNADLAPIRAGGLLVADECHRYGSAVNHLALDTRFVRRLGLSATYAREDGGGPAWLDPYFGGTCYRLGYRRALDDGVTARFTVALIGVRFSPAEQCRYDDLTRIMGGLAHRLLDDFGLPSEPFAAFLMAVNLLAGSDGDGSNLARSWLAAMVERRRLLADTPAKDAALAALVPAVTDADRTIVFTQSIAASERGCRALASGGLRSGVIHSRLSREDRRVVLGSFADGQLDVLSAPRVLDEGIDVPAADLAIIVGASRSRRQMIQRMGRVLRRKPDGRRARFAVVFVAGTVEDPARGAHQAFLEEVLGVADRVDHLGHPGPAGWSGPALRKLRVALAPSWAGAPPRVGGRGSLADSA